MDPIRRRQRRKSVGLFQNFTGATLCFGPFHLELYESQPSSIAMGDFIILFEQEKKYPNCLPDNTLVHQPLKILKRIIKNFVEEKYEVGLCFNPELRGYLRVQTAIQTCGGKYNILPNICAAT
jgi:hypothetical protein